MAPVNVPPSLSQAAFALEGVPPYAVSQVSSDAASRTLTVQPDSSLSQLAPSLSVPGGSLQVLAGRWMRDGGGRWSWAAQEPDDTAVHFGLFHPVLSCTKDQ